ncbi:MAG: hemopexin repeat-containing protein [Oleispira sp.]
MSDTPDTTTPDTSGTIEIDALKKVFIIGIDGTRPDVIQQANTPNFDRLVAEGAYSEKMQSEDTSWSASGWSSVLTGVYRDKHGVTENTFSGSNLANISDVFKLLESSAKEIETARVSSWDGIYKHIPTSADQDFFYNYSSTGDTQTTAKTLELLATKNTDALYHYFALVDVAGHDHGFHRDVAEYVSAMEAVDVQLGQMMRTIENRANYANENWMIIATTDHGGDSTGQHGNNNPEHRSSWMLVSGQDSRIPRGELFPEPSQVDLVATVMNFFELPQDANLDGHSLLNQAAQATSAFNNNLIFNGDAEYDRAYSEMKFEGNVSGWLDIDGGTSMKYGASEVPAKGSVANGGNNFFAGTTYRDSAMLQTVDVSNLALTAATSFELSADLGGYSDNDDSASVIARFDDGSGGAAVYWGNNKAYFFKGNQYYRYDLSADKVDDGYPKDLSASSWPGLEKFTDSAANIDAAINWGNGKAFFFKGEQYIRYDIAADKADEGYPMNIAADWPGLEKFEGGAQNIDAAVEWSNGVVYFFKGNQYIKYDKSADKTQWSYPRFISIDSWDGLQIWPANIDAALYVGSSQAYMFKEGQYVRFNPVLDKVIDGYPKKIDNSTWNGMGDWYFGKRSVEIGPVTETDRNSQTTLLHRTLNGTVPVGTQSIEVSIFFDASWQRNDGYADNVSLILKP